MVQRTARSVRAPAEMVASGVIEASAAGFGVDGYRAGGTQAGASRLVRM